MDERILQEVILNRLKEIAPEAAVDRLDPKKSFHDQIEMDSVDFLNLMLSLEQALQVRIAEADFPKLSSLDGCISYLLPLVADAAVANLGSHGN